MMKDTQDALHGREKEKALKQELGRVLNELEKEKSRAKQAMDKVGKHKIGHRSLNIQQTIFELLQNAQESRQVTALELRVSTQKSRIAELEGSVCTAGTKPKQ